MIRAVALVVLWAAAIAAAIMLERRPAHASEIVVLEPFTHTCMLLVDAPGYRATMRASWPSRRTGEMLHETEWCSQDDIPKDTAR